MRHFPELKKSAANDGYFQSARRGTTFAVQYAGLDDNEVWLSCLGLPASRVGECDVVRGDTACSATLPLLCLMPDALAQPSTAIDRHRGRWLAARVAASQRVRGDVLGTVASADARCAAEFGAGFRVARWRDHGEDFSAQGHIEATSRLWIDVDNAPAANCWAR